MQQYIDTNGHDAFPIFVFPRQHSKDPTNGPDALQIFSPVPSSMAEACSVLCSPLIHPSDAYFYLVDINVYLRARGLGEGTWPGGVTAGSLDNIHTGGYVALKFKMLTMLA